MRSKCNVGGKVGYQKSENPVILTLLFHQQFRYIKLNLFRLAIHRVIEFRMPLMASLKFHQVKGKFITIHFRYFLMEPFFFFFFLTVD